MTVSADELRQAIGQVKEILEGIEAKIEGTPAEAVDPYVRRRQILQRIYWSESMERDDLMALLADFSTHYGWIGQQVKKGYLTVSETPRGQRYSVTQKAVREERLRDDEADIAGVSSLSNESFARDWDSEEDAAYDAL